jgi:hypothetical protein
MRARLRHAVPVAALSLALTACGGNQPAAAPTTAPTAEPAAQAPTRTPRPTREPTAEPRPTEAPTVTTLGDSEVQAVEFGALSTYEHPSGVFAIDVPDNWTLQNNDKPDEIIHVWTDPSRNGGVIVDIFENDTAYTGEELVEILTRFLENSFGSEPEYTAEDAVEQTDGSQLVVWSYVAKADNDVEVKLLGNSFIEQRENKVSILTTLVPAEQFDATVESTNEIINSYKIDPSAKLVIGEGGAADGSITGGATGLSDAAAAPATVVAVGEPVQVGNLTLTVTGVEEPEGDGSLLKPEAGNKFLVVRTVFENSGGAAEPISTMLQMTLVDQSGKEYKLDILAATLAEQTPDGEVPAGGKLEGGVGFQVPEDATGLTFVFSPLIGGDPVGVALE